VKEENPEGEAMPVCQQSDTHIFFALGRDAKYCDVFVCLSARITQKPHGQTPPNFLCKLPMFLARSSSGGVAIHYVFPVLWMISYFHITALWHPMCISTVRTKHTLPNCSFKLPISPSLSWLVSCSTSLASC